MFAVLRKKYASNILFWIIFFFIIRLFNITSPPIEMAHNWRQAFTNIVARNFLEIDNNIFYPRALIFGNNPGIVGTEFPLLNYLIYIFAKLFGYAHWYGRLINLAVTSVGIWYFYRIVFKYLKPSIAFNSTIILICSIWFIFARKSMPDTFSISIVFIGLYYGLNYLYEKGTGNLICYVLFTMLGILCKIPGIYFLCVFAVPLLNEKVSLQPKFYFAIATILFLIPVFLWYFYWVPHLDGMYGNRLYFPRSLKDGSIEVFGNLKLLFERFYFSSLQSYICLTAFLIGMFFLFKELSKVIVFTFFLLVFVFFIFILKTGIVFPLHSYYIIPFTPLMVIIAAFALDHLKNKNLQLLVLFLIIIESVANQQDDFFTKTSQIYKLGLENVADQLSNRNDLIAVNGGESPQLIYFAHRNGWRLSEEQLNDNNYIHKIKEEGCRYIFLDKHWLEHSGSLSIGKEVYNDEDFIVYQLN